MKDVLIVFCVMVAVYCAARPHQVWAQITTGGVAREAVTIFCALVVAYGAGVIAHVVFTVIRNRKRWTR